MQFKTILRISSILLMLFSVTMLPSALVSLLYSDGAHMTFILSFLVLLTIGFVLWLPVYRYRGELRTRDGFVITIAFWLVLGLAGSFPFYMATATDLSFTDAFFESFSGLTTTGATVITGLDDLPKSILFYRQQLQWLGGMGIIVLAVAILPMLGIGGMQLYRAETPGPVKDSKLKPRITETAKALWYIYLTLTSICAFSYWVVGMDVFDAITHAFSTVAIGGFSTHDASIGYFDSAAVESVAMVFMLLSAANFGLHFLTWQNRSIKHYFLDPEYQYFLMIFGAVVMLCVGMLWLTSTYDTLGSLRYGMFETVSILTTTGFAAADFSIWPLYVPFLLILASYIGGCAGSTAGGIKVIRFALLFKQGVREIKRLIHPQGVFPIKIGNKAVNDNVIQSVWGFFAVYVMMFSILMIILLASGMDFLTTWSAVGASLNNLGPGLGEVALDYGSISDVAKWTLTFAMLLGRLEIFSLLVLLTPMFWRN